MYLICTLFITAASLPAIFAMEHMMEHVARTLNKDPLAVKTLNLYQQGQVNTYYINSLSKTCSSDSCCLLITFANSLYLDITQPIKVSKGAKIRNQHNQVPSLCKFYSVTENNVKKINKVRIINACLILCCYFCCMCCFFLCMCK